MSEKYQNYLGQSFVVFDIETSGLYPDRDDILEIAAIKLRGKQEVARYEALIQPTKAIPPEAEKVHGLNELFLLVNGRSVKEVLPEFLSFIEGSIVTGHNIREFDWLFILHQIIKLSLPQPANKLIDTLELARKLLTLPSYTLTNVGKHFNFEIVNAHRAMPDVEFNTKVFMELMELLFKQEL